MWCRRRQFFASDWQIRPSEGTIGGPVAESARRVSAARKAGSSERHFHMGLVQGIAGNGPFTLYGAVQ
jgi:hypothetical protein